MTATKRAQAPTGVALVTRAAAQSALSIAWLEQVGLPWHDQLAFLSRWEEAYEHSAQHSPILFVCEFPHPDVGLEQLREIRRLLPSAAVLVWLTDDQPGHVAALMRDGFVDVLMHHDLDPGQLQRRLGYALSRDLIRRVMQKLPSETPHALAQFIERLLLESRQEISPQRATALYSAPEYVLRADLLLAGYPPLGRLIRWCRLFHAAYLLENRQRRVEQAALLLGFPSRNALYNQFKRYTGLSPQELQRRGGGLDQLVNIFFNCFYEGDIPPQNVSTGAK